MNESIIAGTLALSGVLIGYVAQWLRTRSEQHERRNRLLREKYEKFCALVVESHPEFLSGINQSGRDALDVTFRCPSAAYHLSLIYFPELRDYALEYSNAIASTKLVFLDGFDPRIAASLSTQFCHNYPNRHQAVMDAVVEKRTVVENAIQEYAEKYTKA